jgi:glycosyltransferase involved in cell wall biosynthesis
MVKVSVITTVYNGEKFILDNIKSVLGQTSNNFEMIITDDGSTDNTPAILQKVRDPRIKIFIKGRMGRQAALNFAVSKSIGEYVAILDADDIALPKRLHIQTKFLDDNPDVGLVSAGKRFRIDEQGKTIEYMETEYYTDSAIRKILGYKNPLFHSSVMFRRKLFDKIHGYDVKLSGLEDWDLYIRIAPHCKIVNLPEYLSGKRRHDHQFFDGVNGLHLTKMATRARAMIIFRAVKYLHAPKRNLIRALRLYLRSTFLSFYKYEI